MAAQGEQTNAAMTDQRATLPTQTRLSQEAMRALRDVFGDRLASCEDARRQHANTLTWLPEQAPDVVVWPTGVADVQALLEVARRHRLPVIPFGAGTSLEGQVNAPGGGICVDFSRMNRILRVSQEDFDVTVEAGLTLRDLQDGLRATGLCFPVDPGSPSATIGGMAATRASGTTTVRFGAMPENVLAVKAVLADGRIVETGTRARKSAAGYDLTRLFIGSEGTLALIVELTLRLRPRPQSVQAGVVCFPSIGTAADATIAVLQSGITPDRIELLDAAMLAIANAQLGTALPTAGPALFVEVSGTPAAAAEHMGAIVDVFHNFGGTLQGTAESDAERRKLWRARHDAFLAVRRAYPGCSFIVTDVCVPISCLTTCLEETIADLCEFGLPAPIVGHVGDGNFHALAVLDPAVGDCEIRAERVLDRLVRRAVAMGGTCTGEHGIGQGKACYLELEAQTALPLMRDIKRALDPLGILNPGKIFRD